MHTYMCTNRFIYLDVCIQLRDKKLEEHPGQLTRYVRVIEECISVYVYKCIRTERGKVC
jgi:hypothetical protein